MKILSLILLAYNSEQIAPTLLYMGQYMSHAIKRYHTLKDK